jgi:hypothetical protein
MNTLLGCRLKNSPVSTTSNIVGNELRIMSAMQRSTVSALPCHEIIWSEHFESVLPHGGKNEETVEKIDHSAKHNKPFCIILFR